MLINGFTSWQPLESAEREVLDDCPYAALVFISSVGPTSRVRLSNLLNDLGVDDRTLARQAAQELSEALLRGGHVFQVRDGVLSAFPPYAIQRDESLWEIFGDARVDDSLRDGNEIAFEVASRLTGEEVTLHRLFMAKPEEGPNLLERARVRAFPLSDLMELVPNVSNLVAPVPWPGFDPGPFARWERLGNVGDWIEVDSVSRLSGLCRGIAQDPDGRALSVRYFFKHSGGWSPVTEDEGLLWTLKLLGEAGAVAQAQYDDALGKLTLGFRVPYAAYMALRILASSLVWEDGLLRAYGLSPGVAEVICSRLSFSLGRGMK